MRNALILASLAAASLSAQETYSTWGQHKYVLVNTSATGVNLTGEVRAFPVLVRLGAADSNVFKQSIGRGADVRFTKFNDATRLAHHVDHWDSAARSAAIWVLADTIKANTKRAGFRLHWAKSGAADSSNASAVFDTANGFQAVFHMGEATGDTLRDATPNRFKGLALATGTRTVPSDTAGHIGRGKRFNGGPSSGSPSGSDNGTTGGFYEILNSAAGPLNFPEAGPYLVSAWVRLGVDPATTNYRFILSKGDYQYNLMKNNLATSAWEFNPYTPGPGWQATRADGIAAQDVWQHVVAVRYAAGTDTLYADGVAVPGPNFEYASTAARVTTFNATIGRRADHSNNTTTAANNRFWTGSLDEIRFSNRARGSAWIKLEYATQKAGQTAVSFSDTLPTDVVSLSESRGFRAPASGFSVKASGKGLAFHSTSGEGSQMRVTVVDMWGRAQWSATARAGSALAWDGRARGGELAPSGLYAVRAEFLDAAGKSSRTVDRKATLLR